LLAGLLLLGVFPGWVQAQVVVLVHPRSGRFVIVHDQPSPRAVARRKALEDGRGRGWKPLLANTVAGAGAMFCFRPKGGGDVRFFVAQGKASMKAAVVDARQQAITAVAGSGPVVYICGIWFNRNRYPLDSAADAPAEELRGTTSSTVTGVRG
jgi:hypothetical protein